MCATGWRPLAVWALALATLTPSRTAAGPRDELLPLVPDDVSFCLVAEDLRGHAARLAELPWVQRLAGSPLGQAVLQTPEVQKLLKAEGELRRHLDVTWPQLRDDVLGDCVVFAFRHGGGREGEERGLALLWAREPALLGRLLDRINEGQKRSGELRALENRRYRGVSYVHRQEGQKDQYYFLDGPLFAFTGDEATLCQVIDLRRATADKPAASVLKNGFARLPGGKALLTLWLNCRAFDRDLEAEQARATGDDARVLKALHRYWLAADAAALALDLTGGPELRLTVQGRPAALPAAARNVLSAAAEPSEAGHHFPAEPLLTLTARVDFAALLNLLDDFLGPAESKRLRDGLQQSVGAAMGLDFVGDVLPHVGPDLGLCVAQSAHGKAIPDALVALRLRPGEGEAPVDQSLFKTLQFFVGLAVFDYNRKHAERLRIQSVQQGGLEVKYLEHPRLPEGLTPAYALKGGYLLVATSPAAVARFRASAPPAPEPALLTVSFGRLGSWLGEHGPAVVSLLAGGKGEPAPGVPSWLAAVAGPAVFEGLTLRQTGASGQVTWSLRLRPAGGE